MSKGESSATPINFCAAIFQGGVLKESRWWCYTGSFWELLKNCKKNGTASHSKKNTNIICNQINAVDADTKWVALELMLASSASTIASVKKMAKLSTKIPLAKSLFSKLKSSINMLSNTVNRLRTIQLELLANPLLFKSRYPINTTVNKLLRSNHLCAVFSYL